MKIRNIIFDFDGTLMDTAPIILRTMEATIKELELPERSEDECRATIGLRLDSIPAALFPEYENLSVRFVTTYRRMFNKINSPGSAKPFPGVMETIHDLKQHGLNLAIASSRSHKSLADFTDETSLTGMFEMLVGGDDVANGKPAPDPVLAICNTLDWKTSETLVVGDACYDIEMGNNACCRTCAVTYGNQSRNQLNASNPTFIIDRFAELKQILEL